MCFYISEPRTEVSMGGVRTTLDVHSMRHVAIRYV